MTSKPQSALGRLLPMVGGTFVVLGVGQVFYLVDLASKHDVPELALAGAIAAVGSFVTGILLMTLGVMTRSLDGQLNELVTIASGSGEQQRLLEEQVRQNKDILDVQRRQVAWLEKLAPAEVVVREPAGIDSLPTFRALGAAAG